MTIEMRELRGDDLYTLLGILGKLDVKDDIVALFEKNIDQTAKIIPLDHKKKEPTKAEQKAIKAREKEEAIAAKKRGMELTATVLQKVLFNIKTIRAEINDLLADLTDLDISEIRELGLKEYTGLIIGFFKKPELKDFFESIGSLLE